ncbi:MAG: hypothetical protein ACFFDS_00975 [Candidatus Thorarchaeota archaeon]
MNIATRKFFIFVSIILLAISISKTTQAYSDIHGIEYDDVIDVTCDIYQDSVLVTEFTEYAPFRFQVNENLVNKILVDAVIGLKVGETKPYITWVLDYQNGTIATIEYFDTTILRIAIDSTPEKPIGRGVIITFSVIGGLCAVVGMGYLAYKARTTLFAKKCAICKKVAIGTCKKCGRTFCERCYSNGCPYCKSRTLLKFKS